MMQEKIKPPFVPTRQLYLLAGFILVFAGGYLVGYVVPGQSNAAEAISGHPRDDFTGR